MSRNRSRVEPQVKLGPLTWFIDRLCLQERVDSGVDRTHPPQPEILSDQNDFVACLSNVSGLWNAESACAVPAVVSAGQPDSLRDSSHVNSVSDRVGSLGVNRYLQISSVSLISLTDAAQFVLN